MRHDYQWHQDEVRRRRARDWDMRPEMQPRPRGPWSKLGAMVVIGVVAGLVIAQGLSETDRARYDRLLTGVGLAPAAN